MKIVICSSLNETQREVISDDRMYRSIEENTEYALVFTTGTVTLKAFKEIYTMDKGRLARKKVIFIVKNMEHFLYKMKHFRNLQYVIKDEYTVKEHNNDFKRGKNYLKYEEKIRRKFDKKESEETDVERRLQTTLCPDIYASIKTSLSNPQAYLSEECIASRIFQGISDGRYKVIGDVVEAITSKETEAAIRSLLYCGIIRIKNDRLIVSDLLK